MMSARNNNKKLLDFSQSVMNIRFWEEKNLPLSQSRIAFDLLLFIANCHYSDTHLTLKYLFNSLSYSERGVRYVLEQFVDNGWCEVVDSTSDKRFRHVVASAKLTNAFEAYESICVGSYARLVVERASDIQSSNDEAFETVQLVAASEEHSADEQMR
jgi:hypothetical protein